MKEHGQKWTKERVAAFNAMEPADYMNVVSLSGQPLVSLPEDGAVLRTVAQLAEEREALRDMLARVVQQLQDEVDEASACGGDRPDLVALVEESERLLVLGGEHVD